MVQIVTMHTPDEVGFPNRKNWYVDIIRQWVQQNFEMQYIYTGILDLLYRSNLSYTQSTYILTKANPQKQEEF
ncbi:winged helix-turn-helix domain-containing protein [Anaerobacterium chartisolvens]|uniref:winged helix-turn-helix domain-containing protein n=1 Tax=Anaerobacterium chartisolvens TaxID=1297424 RepID=UPI000DF2B6E0|nr:winged helix-turn-helix domain-containing protein [Anaerobacterium chartisolvens]